jgi:hypothetical protein
MLSIEAIAAAIAVRRGILKLTATEHGGAVVYGDAAEISGLRAARFPSWIAVWSDQSAAFKV